MKTIKNKILSVLLFTFAFFVMHDHIMATVYSDVKYEYSLTEKTQSAADLKSNIHDTIHTSLDLNREEIFTVELKFSDLKPTTFIVRLTSSTHLVPQRPPLA